MEREFIEFQVDGVPLKVMTLARGGSRAPIVFLHGFGSTQEDFAAVAQHPKFNGRPLVAYDAPGHGHSECPKLDAISVPFLRRTAEAVIDDFGIGCFHLVGHSMGGLTALELARERPKAVLSFSNIEGNLAPEDCFLSRQIFDYPEADAERFFAAFRARVRAGSDPSSLPYAAALRENVRAGAVGPIFRSLLEYSDRGDLIDVFLGLEMPKLFVHGHANRTISYLGRLAAGGIKLSKIPQSGHFPMYANPLALWQAIGEFIAETEGRGANGR